MAYKIDEATPEEKTKAGKNYKVVELGFAPLLLGFYNTPAEAEIARAEWIARDELQDEVDDFQGNMLDKYVGRLTADEIREIIKGI